MYKLGVIGFGIRVFKGVIPPLCELSDEILVTAIADPDEDTVRQRIAEDSRGISENVKIYKTADEMLENESMDGIIIGTRCSVHTEMAIKAMKRNVPIFLEKPVCISEEQLWELKAANDKYKPLVTVSFPLRYTLLTELAKEIIDSGQIGDVLQVKAFNDVRYGRGYYHGWYRDEKETGGLWLQKATHDFDYLNYILGDPFEEVFARYTRQLFKGDMPAGLKCEECDKKMTCPDGPFMVKHKYMDPYNTPQPDWQCCFAVDTGNEDCGSALLKCKSGAIATYSQNFFARHKAASRGARFYGYKGTLEFDWYKSKVKVYMHTSPREETYKFDDKINTSHFGGDLKLAEIYIDMLKGKTKKSYLEEGMQSAAICLMAKKSCETGKNIIIPEI